MNDVGSARLVSRSHTIHNFVTEHSACDKFFNSYVQILAFMAVVRRSVRMCIVYVAVTPPKVKEKPVLLALDID